MEVAPNYCENKILNKLNPLCAHHFSPGVSVLHIIEGSKGSLLI